MRARRPKTPICSARDHPKGWSHQRPRTTRLFQNQLDFVYALYIAMLLLNVIVIVFLIFSTNLLTKVIQIPTRFLGMVILILGFVGVYSLRNSVVDCAIASGFGVLGLILKRLNLPVVPIVLGMVLGGIMEVKLRSAMIRVKTPLDFVERPSKDRRVAQRPPDPARVVD